MFGHDQVIPAHGEKRTFHSAVGDQDSMTFFGLVCAAAPFLGASGASAFADAIWVAFDSGVPDRVGRAGECVRISR
jgi:hypothetical protein